MEQRDRFENIPPTSTIDPPSDDIQRQRGLKSCNGWHAELENHDGCTDDNNYPDLWLDTVLKAQMFHLSAEACCDMFFPDGCQVYGRGCQEPAGLPSEAAGPSPSSNANCVSPGWHPELDNHDGCSNDENYPEQWLMSEKMKSNMFKASSEACCSLFFKDNCEVYDLGCEIDPNMEQQKSTPKPTNRPGRNPTPKPTPEPSSSSPTVTPPAYYIVHGNGICVDENETPRPYYITKTYHDIMKCCQNSFAKDKCLAAIPDELSSQIPDKIVEISIYGSISLQLSIIPKYNSRDDWSTLKNVLMKTITLVMLKSPIAAQGIVVELLTFAGQSFQYRFRRRLGESAIEDEINEVALSSLRSRAERRASSSQLLQFEMTIPARCTAACQFAGGHLGQDAFYELESHLEYYVTSGVFSSVLTNMGKSSGLFSEADATSGTLAYRSAIESSVTFIPTWSPTEEPPPTSIPTLSPSATLNPSGGPTESPSFQPIGPPPTNEPTSRPTTECSASKWYYKIGQDLCTNDSSYPSLWEGTNLLFDAVDECCAAHSPGTCAVKDVCEMQISYCGGLYHPTTPFLRTCTNHYKYPPAWNNNPKFTFRSAEQCCEAFYGDDLCLMKDACY